MRLRIVLPPNWELVPGTFQVRKKAAISENILQVSITESVDRVATNWTYDQLAELAQAWASRIGGKVTKTMGGTCSFGRFGMAQFHTDRFPHCQAWVLSDGINFINATYTCVKAPPPEEQSEIDYIVSQLGLNAGQ